MKKENLEEEKIFNIQFNKSIIILALFVILFCVIGIIVSVWRIVNFGINGMYDILKYPFLIAVCVFAIILVVSILGRSVYSIDKNSLTLQYGFIKNRINVKEITQITLDTEKKKLTLSIGEQYMVINLSPEWNETFIRTLLEVNPDIDYGFTLTEK